MPLPKKISPDNIIDAVIECRYESELPFEVLLGLFFSAFDKSYSYTTMPLKGLAPGLFAGPLKGQPLNTGGQSLLYNNKITIKLLPASFIFSCLETYLGWAEFKAEISRALEIIQQTGYITKWNRVGLRYISEYIDTDLRSCTKFMFSFGIPGVESTSTAFRSDFEYQGSKVILNLNNKIPIFRPQGGSQPAAFVPTSIIDVDVIMDPVAVDKTEDLINMIEHSHETEKWVFFNLLTAAYLQTLKPEY